MAVPAGSIRFNTDSAKMEIYNGDKWWEIDSTSPYEQAGGTRGLFGGGENPSLVARIDYINVDTTGNAEDFGDLSATRRNVASTSDRTRLVFTGGYTSGPATYYNILEFVTIASLGGTTTFGELTDDRSRHAGFGSATRGFAAGGLEPGSGKADIIDYITIQSTGNAKDFGDLSSGRYGVSGSQSPTRGLMFGGQDTETRNYIEYVTMSTTGNASDFGDLARDSSQGTAGSNAVRAVAGAGTDPSVSKVMEYITIASLGNATNFGDLVQNRLECGGGACSPTRIVIPGSFSSNNVCEDEIDYHEIMTTGDFIDFGDSTVSSDMRPGTSNGHGGLG